MRIASLLLLSALVAAPAFAKDDVQCEITAEPGDRVAKGKDVVVEENAHVHDAVAVDGNVIVKKGATVRSALALHGSVTVEPGAHVKESVISIGGKTVTDGAKVDGSVVALGHGLHVRGDDGTRVDLDLKIGDTDLSKEVLRAALKGIHHCKVVEASDSGT